MNPMTRIILWLAILLVAGVVIRFLVSLLNKKLNSKERIGKRGEALTVRELELVRLFGRKGKTLQNLYLPKDNGGTSEIDVVYITQKGIFVIESKNYSGWIFGNENDQYWTASLPNGNKNQFYNPVKQNKTHIKWLQNTVGDQVPLYSVIAFSERCELKKITVTDPSVKVIKRDRIYATIREIWESSEDRLTENEVEELFQKLSAYTNVDETVKEKHIQEIKGTESPAVEPTDDNETALLCPRCGKKLVLRTAKRGANAGQSFYGCSGFPSCKYTRNM